MPSRRSTDGIGGRIRVRRELAGLSLRAAANRAGLDPGHWSRIEAGQRGADNRFTIARIAEALSCPVAELTGVLTVPTDAPAAAGRSATYHAVRAIVSADLEYPPDDDAAPPTATIDQCRASVDLIAGLRAKCDYTGAARLIPDVIRALHWYATRPGTREDWSAALRGIVVVADAASFIARHAGMPTAAPVIADRARQAATALGDPVMTGLAAWTAAHAALSCELHTRAVAVAERGIADLAPHAQTGGGIEVLGQLHLTAAFALYGRSRPDDAAPHIAEAERLAQRVGETDTLYLYFGPTNVDVWRVGMETDGGDPAVAANIAATTNVTRLDGASRRASFYLDAGRALSTLGRDREAVRMLITAERTAPQRVHGDALVAESARAMLGRSSRDAAGSALRGLCERLGVATM